MGDASHEKIRCPVCGELRAQREIIPGAAIDNAIQDEIRVECPEWSEDNAVCTECFARVGAQHMRRLLEEETSAFDSEEREMADSLEPLELTSQDVNEEIIRHRTPAERISDSVTDFVGSWAFLIAQLGLLVVWILANSYILLRRPFDPYPFILLNLVFSLWASMQAPLIMMSQNRQDDRDRLRNANDYRVNLRAEMEIQHLNRKLDQLLTLHWPQLLEIQQIQMEMMRLLTRTASPPEE